MTRLTFHHLGVAVPSIPAALPTYTDTLGYRVLSGPFDDPVQNVSVCFLGNDREPMVVELIAPLAGRSPITQMLDKGVAAYHVCYQVDDLEGALAELKAQRWVMVGKPVPAVAFEGRLIAWLYAPTKQLIELVQAPSPAGRAG